jgi:hypothetical protein
MKRKEDLELQEQRGHGKYNIIFIAPLMMNFAFSSGQEGKVGVTWLILFRGCCPQSIVHSITCKHIILS